MTHRFAIGEQARVNRDNADSANVRKGDVITIIDILDRSDYYVETNCGMPWYIADKHLEKIVADTPETNPLYSYRASDELTDSAWEILVNAVGVGVAWEDAKTQFATWEHEYKTVTELPIPGSWRSAKSVIKGAINNDVPLFNEAGVVRGKSAVEADIKGKKAVGKAELTPDEKLDDMLSKASAFATQHNLDWYGRIESVLKNR